MSRLVSRLVRIGRVVGCPGSFPGSLGLFPGSLGLMRVNFSLMRNVEIANDFFTDGQDLIFRYDITVDRLGALKSRRMKCFSDLRGAYECALKGIVAYNSPGDSDRKSLIKRIEKFGHRISLLEAELECNVREQYGIEIRGGILEQLPVGLRYATDGYDFVRAKEAVYYSTIGSDVWIFEFRRYVGCVCTELGRALSSHSRIISVSDIPKEQILGETYNKYR